MSDHYEGETLKLTVKLSSGQAADGKVQFEFFQDDAPLDPVEKSVGAREATAGTWVSHEFACPLVPADKASYRLDCRIKADGRVVNEYLDLRVWPKSAKLAAADFDNNTKHLNGFTFVVRQEGFKDEEYRVRGSLGAPDPYEFRLQKGKPFTFEAVAPFEIKATTYNSLRDIKVEAVRHFVAEFIRPAVPLDRKIKQHVNLPTADEGRDGKGSKVKLKVGVQGDADGTNRPPIGNQGGVVVYVKVEYGSAGPHARSRRSTPRTELVAGSVGLSDRVEVRAGVEYTARVGLSIVDGTGEFEVELGLAGGDTCKVSIGSTSACGDAHVTFTNWRKLYYEILAPVFMALEDHDVAAGTLKDFPAAIRTEMEALTKPVFLELEIEASNVFSPADMKGKWFQRAVPRSFLGRAAGAGILYVVDKGVILESPRDFVNRKGPRTICLRLCDQVYSNQTLEWSRHLTHSDTATAPDYEIALGATRWFPFITNNVDFGYISELKWKAQVPANTYVDQPALHFAGSHAKDPRTSIYTKYVHVVNTETTLPHDATFSSLVGKVPSTLSQDQKNAIDAYLRRVCAAAGGRAALNFALTGERDTPDRIARMQAVQDAIGDSVARLNLTTHGLHPGLDGGGNPREGDARLFIDVARSTEATIALTLPSGAATDPGSFVGPALTATECPVTITCRYARVVPLGGSTLPRSEDRGGQIIQAVDPAEPRAVANAVVHEIAHDLKMTAYAAGPPGLGAAKHVDEDEPNPDYQHNGTKGHVFVGKGYNGEHCAWGLSDLQKARPTYGIEEYNASRCTMYASSMAEDARMNAQGFCPQCQDYLRAQDASNLNAP